MQASTNRDSSSLFRLCRAAGGADDGERLRSESDPWRYRCPFARSRGLSPSPPRERRCFTSLVAVDPTTGEAEFRTGCGWYTRTVGAQGYVRPTRKLQPGLWAVSLHGAEFDLDSAPGQASGNTQTVTLAIWEHYVEHYGWSGYLALAHGSAAISDADTRTSAMECLVRSRAPSVFWEGGAAERACPRKGLVPRRSRRAPGRGAAG